MTTKYKNKYNELDDDKFEAIDPKGYQEYLNLKQQVSEARKAAQKKRWPYVESITQY